MGRGGAVFGQVADDVDKTTCHMYSLTTFCLHLAMLQSGSMRWTVGSSMYSKARLSLIWARSTLTLICTGPTPDTEGAE